MNLKELRYSEKGFVLFLLKLLDIRFWRPTTGCLRFHNVSCAALLSTEWTNLIPMVKYAFKKEFKAVSQAH